MAGSVAVIGAGPGGLAAARWLLSQGFEPTIFDQAPVLGGQWTGLPGLSGVWPTMHTNTSRVLTAFSDLEHETGNVYPSGRDILAYLGPGSLCRDVRAHVAHPVRHTGRAPQQIRRRMAGASLRHDRALRQGRGGNRQVPVPRHPASTGTPHPTSAGVCSSRAARSAPWRSPPNSPSSARPTSWSPSGGSGTCCRSSPRVSPPTTGYSRDTEPSRTSTCPPRRSTGS